MLQRHRCLLTLTLAALCAPGCQRSPEGADADRTVADPAPEPTTQAPVSVASVLAADKRADRAAWRARLQWPDECEDAFEASDASQTSGIDIHELEHGALLVQVRCAAGAYQPSSLVMYVDATRSPVATAMTFQTYASPDGERLERVDTRELWGELSVAQDGHVLTVLSLSRQTADCGTWTEYTLAEGTPRLVALYARLPCPTVPDAPVNSAPGQPPADWKRTDVQ
jgi:hypothetical protein